MMERALGGLDLVRNRSDKDKTRADMLSSVIDRLRVLETDLSRLVSDGGFEDIREEGVTLLFRIMFRCVSANY